MRSTTSLRSVLGFPGLRSSQQAPVGPRLAIAALVSILCCATPGQAEMIVWAPSLQVTQGGSGSFDLVVENDDPTGGTHFDITSFAVELSLSGGTGVRFTGVTIATNLESIFQVSSTTFGADFSSNFSPLSFNASDTEFGNPPDFYRTISPGGSYGLARVSFEVDADAALGVRTLFLGDGTNLSDNDANLLTPTLRNGEIRVLDSGGGPISAVPEPATLTMAVSGLLMAGLFALPRIRRARLRS